MSALEDILSRRARLVAEAQAQRGALSDALAGCRSVLGVADRGLAWGAWLRARPYMVVAAAAALAVLKPGRMLGWSTRLLTLWRVGRFFYEAVGTPKRSS